MDRAFLRASSSESGNRESLGGRGRLRLGCGMSLIQSDDVLMRHVPGRLVGNPQHPAQFQGAHAFLRATDQVKGLHPLGEGNVRAFKDRADGHGELTATAAAVVEAIPSTTHRDNLLFLAPRTDCAIRPAQFLQILSGLVVGQPHRINHEEPPLLQDVRVQL